MNIILKGQPCGMTPSRPKNPPIQLPVRTGSVNEHVFKINVTRLTRQSQRSKDTTVSRTQSRMLRLMVSKDFTTSATKRCTSFSTTPLIDSIMSKEVEYQASIELLPSPALGEGRTKSAPEVNQSVGGVVVPAGA